MSKKSRPRTAPGREGSFNYLLDNNELNSYNQEQKKKPPRRRHQSNEVNEFSTSSSNAIHECYNSYINNPSTSSSQNNRRDNFISRVPCYKKNGPTFGYNPPFNSDLRFSNVHRNYNNNDSINSVYDGRYGRNSHYYHNHYFQHQNHHQLGQQDYEIETFLPADVKYRQERHQCKRIELQNRHFNRSAPGSIKTTPTNSKPGTPLERSSTKESIKSTMSTPSRNFSRQPSFPRGSFTSSFTTSSNSKKFDSYMPLCEVQSGLKKGEIIEGILRINPRNFEDAYIKAPDQLMDIYLGGIRDRNRALNGDKVGVIIKPKKDWKILYENIRLSWNKWNMYLNECIVDSKDISNLCSNNLIKIVGNFLTSSPDISSSNQIENVDKQENSNERKIVLHCNFISVETVNEKSNLPEEFCNNSKKTRNRNRKRRNKNKQSISKNDNESNQQKLPELPKIKVLTFTQKKQIDIDQVEINNSKNNGIPEGGEINLNETREVNIDSNNGIDVATQNENLECQQSIVDKDKNEMNETEQLNVDLNNGNDIPVQNKNVDVNHNQNDSRKKETTVTNLYDLMRELSSLKILDDGKKQSKNVSKNNINNGHKISNDKYLNVDLLMKHDFWFLCVQRTAFVVRILESNHPRLAGGRLKLRSDRDRDWAIFSPVDSRLPRMLVPMFECPKDFYIHPEHYQQSMFIARLIYWPIDSLFARGSLKRCLGTMGDIETETEIIITENQIDQQEFEESVYEGLPKLSENDVFKIPEEEINKRRSFCDECVFTIDPSTARDLDDALSIKLLSEKGPNNCTLYEVGVHIADVAYFVREGLEVDNIARKRTTSVYLVQRMIPMLPRLLCEKLCSLTAGEEKLTFSVVWKLDEYGNIYNEWFGKTIINSCIKLSYELAQNMVDKPNHEWADSEMPPIFGKWTIKNISESVNLLMKIARNLREKRFEGGALKVKNLKLSFVLDPESGLPTGFSPNASYDTNFLVEEFMLMANIAVAKKIYSAYPDIAFLRKHPLPDSKLLKDLQNLCESAKLDVDLSTQQTFKQSISKLIANNDQTSMILSHLLLKSLTLAVYFCAGIEEMKDKDFSHYALNVPLYTHFTSPIRRYPDIIVHRLLAAAIHYDQEISDSALALSEIARRCNDRKYAAKLASEQSSKLFISLYIREIGSLKEKALVVQVLDRAFDVIIYKFSHQVRVYLENMDIHRYQFKTNNGENELTIFWNEQQFIRIKVFTEVDVIISNTEADIHKWIVCITN